MGYDSTKHILNPDKDVNRNIEGSLSGVLYDLTYHDQETEYSISYTIKHDVVDIYDLRINVLLDEETLENVLEYLYGDIWDEHRNYFDRTGYRPWLHYKEYDYNGNNLNKQL